MKKVTIGNNVISVGSFMGPDIEEGTFHYFDVDSLNLHQKGTKKCPCPPIGSSGPKVADDSNEDNEKASGKNN